MINRKNAFTLAEVLITLGIIGVVAALTIPTLMQKTQDREAVSKLKKVYSTISNAYNLAVNDEGAPADNWVNTVTQMGDTFMKYLSVTKDCRSGNCETHSMTTLSGTTFDVGYIPEQYIILSDGTIVAFELDSTSCSDLNVPSAGTISRCGWISVDINGMKKPNTLGKDVFLFAMTNSQIIPFGASNTAGFGNSETFDTACAKGGSASLLGLGCTAWVIYNENMDYLHCAGLSWTGKTKCD